MPKTACSSICIRNFRNEGYFRLLASCEDYLRNAVAPLNRERAFSKIE